jgi:D-glycero-alpha-D-manno-heptose-7-phosphate kinase
MSIRARAPLRISFGGGGTDVPPFCDERGGAVLSATINRHAYATLIPGGDAFDVRSLDYDASITYGLDERFIFDGQLDLVKGVLDHFRRQHGLKEGLRILLHNDAPPGSGLGSSSAITVALIGALARHVKATFDPYRAAETAYRIERIEVGQLGGKQDQFAAAFGGFNFMEFRNGATIVNALRLNPETVCELEYRLVFAYVGGDRVFSRILERQVENYAEQREEPLQAMERLRDLAYQMKDALVLGRLDDFGGLLHEAWEAKKRMAEGISTPGIDAIYDLARDQGAIGGKITGAGGGGFMFFLCGASGRYTLQEALRGRGVQLQNFSFVEEGLRTWQLDA